MKRRLLQVLAMCSALVSATASAETLAEYVNDCKSDLGIATPLPALTCNNGLLYAPSRGGQDPTNDKVGYSRITDTVDLVFNCRWFFTNATAGASVEMLIHNRQTGHTCFFAAKNPLESRTGVSATIVPPDDAANASNYWMQPAEMDAKTDSTDPAGHLRCVECHAAGPYIASPRIAPFLARFGLLNNGHNTIPNGNANDMTPGPRYSAIGGSPPTEPNNPSNPSVFKAWNAIMMAQFYDTDGNWKPDPVACTLGCHAIALNSTNHSIGLDGAGLIPSISLVIDAVNNKAKNVPSGQVGQVIQQIMPPDTYSEYRWVNMDTPTNDSSEVETLQRLQQLYPALACPSGASPAFVQARVVGSDVIYDTSGYADKLRTFNLKDGLTCFSADQTNSHACLDYQTQYKCPSGTWTGWINVTSGQANDNEARTNSTVATRIQSTCGVGQAPVAIQAKFTVPSTSNVVIIDGPPDRLAQFNNLGLSCNNGDQGTNLACSNYVVRFVCPNTAATTVLTTLRTNHPDATGDKTFLTQANSNVNTGINNQYFQMNRQAQQWIIEPITNFSDPKFWTIPVSDRSRAVRLRSRWTNHYATTNDVNRGPNPQNPLFWLFAQASQVAWETQVWIKEPVAFPNENFVRLRTAWIPPTSKSTVNPLYMTLTTTKNGDTGTQDVHILPSSADQNVQWWQFLGVDGSF
jgi:hypothetical protein